MRGRYSRSFGVSAHCVAALWRVKSLLRHRGDRPKLKFEAKNGEGSENSEREHEQEQCNRQ